MNNGRIHLIRIVWFSFLAGFMLTSIFCLFILQKPTFSPSTNTANTNVLSESIAQDVQTSTIPSPDQKILGILLFGYGGAGHDGGFLTDAIQILNIDFIKTQINLISIPRDLWVKLADESELKINATILNSATSKTDLIKTGAPALKKLLTDVTGVKIDYFIGVDFVGFQRAIGINLKGIDVAVAETLDDPWYPIQGEELSTCNMTLDEIKEVHIKYSGFELERQFTCRYKHLHFEKGTVHMEGGDALEYVRSRHGSNEGDISRGHRQQEVLTAMRKKLFSLEALDKLPGFFNEIVKNTQTDINIEIVTYLLPTLKKSRDFKVQTINLSTTNVLSNTNSKIGGSILVPKEGNFKWDKIREFVKEQVNRIP